MMQVKNTEGFVLDQGILLSEQFSDAEQFNNALDTNVWAQTDSDGNHTTIYSSANSRAEMDGGTTVGSTYIRTNRLFSTPCVVRAKLITTTLTETNGEVYPSIRLWVGTNQWVRWGPYKEAAGEDSIGFIKFSDTGDNDQEVDVDATNTDATQREYSIVMTDNKASFYIGNVLKYEMSFTGMPSFYIDLICSTTHIDNAYVDIFWSDFSVRTWDAERARMLSSFIADGDGDYLTGTRLPSNVSIYDVTGAFSGDGGAADDDSIKASLDLAHTDLDDILADTLTISGGTLPASPTGGSLARYIASGGTALGQPLPTNMSLIDIIGDFAGGYNDVLQASNIKASLDLAHIDLDTIIAGSTGTGEGVTQVITKTIDLNVAAGTYDLFTGAVQAVIIQGLIVQGPDAAAAAALVSVSVQTDHTTNQVFINAVDGAFGNLSAEAQLSWRGDVYLDVGNKIQITNAGNNGAGYIVSIHAICVAAANGGTLTVA